TTLCRDMWPNNAGKMIQDKTEMASLPKHRIVPLSYEELCRWICVDPCGMDSATAVWLHPDVVGEEMRVELTIRLQGFVEEVSLGMLGSWNGTVEGAPKALQSVTLSGGLCQEAFDPQVRAISDIRELVLQLLSRPPPGRQSNDGKITLKRRVFDRVRPGDSNTDNVRVPVGEDPAGRLKRLEHLWAVRHVIEAGEQRADGKIVRVNPRVFRPGDFVDVAIAVFAVPMRVSRGRKVVEVMFAPRTVVRLLTPQASMVSHWCRNHRICRI
ncbi:hypothetical protein C8Q79DRAFT_921204, partial [Trametes meyenii]